MDILQPLVGLVLVRLAHSLERPRFFAGGCVNTAILLQFLDSVVLEVPEACGRAEAGPLRGKPAAHPCSFEERAPCRNRGAVEDANELWRDLISENLV